MLGQVVGAHALGGQLRVRFFGDGPASLLRFSVVALGDSADGRGARRFEVEQSAPGRPGEVRLRLEGVGDRDSAEALRGRLVLGESRFLEPLGEGEFYWHELIGCSVETSDGTRLGVVRELWETGAHDVLVVESEAGERYLISTAREIVPEIDLEARRVVVEPIPGLLDPM